MNHILSLCLALCFQSAVAGTTQRVIITNKETNLDACLQQIKKQTGYNIIYLDNTVDLHAPVKENMKDIPLADALETLLRNQNVSYSIKNKTIALYKEDDDQQRNQRGIQLTVKSEVGIPISGASIFADQRSNAVGQTDKNGTINLIVPINSRSLIIRHLNYQDMTLNIDRRNTYEVVLKDKENRLEESVITGIYTRDKESFTGSSATFSGKELKMVSNTNVLQALRTLDPSFSIQENNLSGSDPNVMPDVNIRGKTSVIGLRQQFSTDPNQPLFILDGFESSINVIFDLSMDRVESITLLKDAAATAIYGSKAANGVVVVETVKPKSGQLQLSYSNNSSFGFADLTDYNLMDASEKLTFERLAGFYGPIDENGNIIDEMEAVKFNTRLADIKRGVNSYWMNEPLRKAISSRHNLFAEGGDQTVRYGVGFNYGNNQGVMKGSNRQLIGGNVRIIYRLKRFSFSNNFTIDYNKSDNNLVNFSAFSSMNPYYRKYDEFGNILKIVETFPTLTSSTNLYNPMYDFYLKSFNNNQNTDFRNNFDADWRVLDELRLRGRLSFAKGSNKGRVFNSPFASRFESTTSENRGTYNEGNGSSKQFDFDVSSIYGKALGSNHYHNVNAVIGMRANLASTENSSYTVAGYRDEEYWAPKFAIGYLPGSRPSYSFNDKRSLSFYSNAGYSYRNRYLFDLNFRKDGSSLFAVQNKYTTTWAFGLAWNIHQESFMKPLAKDISLFKLRSSIGTPGNQNFDAYMTMNTYAYNLSYPNPFGLSALISNWGNPHLKWQKTLDQNYGIDLEILNKRLYINFDYFYKTTDPLLIYVEIPTSTGTSQIAQNVGAQKTKGFTGSINYRAIRRDEMLWNINLNVRNMNSTYFDIGNSLDNLNEENKSRNLQRYYDGASTTDLWSVKSLGIDPATGREVFEKKDGTQTFVHDYNDEQVLGNSTPLAEGVVGSMFAYKGFSFSANFRYRYGGQIFLNTLYSKVENISTIGLRTNQDKRALYDRWQKPGDESLFKSISLSEISPISSRFMADENTFACESVSLGYESIDPWTKKLGLSSFQARMYMNEIFRISTVRNERGINYPFARTVSFSISGRF